MLCYYRLGYDMRPSHAFNRTVSGVLRRRQHGRLTWTRWASQRCAQVAPSFGWQWRMAHPRGHLGTSVLARCTSFNGRAACVHRFWAAAIPPG
jgi:hypothetical protein